MDALGLRRYLSPTLPSQKGWRSGSAIAPLPMVVSD